ncbi:hypothetical protein D3C87_1343350 [compost metagenome]
MIHEQKSGARIDDEVTKRVEKLISIEIRYGQATIGIHADETASAAPMGDIHLPSLTLALHI